VFSIFSHVSALATAITSHAINYNMTFPNVTLPNFDARVKDVGQSSIIPLVLYIPMVHDADRAGWEAFTATQHWLEQDVKYNADLEVHPGPVPPKIFSYSEGLFKADPDYDLPPEDMKEAPSEDGDEDGEVETEDERLRNLKDREGEGVVDQDDQFLEGTSFPLWQLGPLPRNASILKLDLLTNPSFEEAITTGMFVKRDILSGVMDLDFLYNSQRWQPGEAPRSVAIVPVKEDLYEDSPVVGLVMGTIKWSDLFEGLLPQGTEGLLAAVEDTCGKDFVFMIQGDEAEFLGYGTADNFTESAKSRFVDFFEIAEAVRDNDNALGTVQQDHREACEVTLTLYSTKAYEDSCTTNRPAVFTTAVVMVFVVTIVAFVVYDLLVTRRQRKLMAQAKRSDAIVSSLFPKHVQQRMMEEAGSADEANTKGKWKGRLASKPGDFHSDGNVIDRGSRPIADLYAESTIMFADIVGFTQWASCRVPSDVFTLLESIFAAFDEVANRRRIYKVRLLMTRRVAFYAPIDYELPLELTVCLCAVVAYRSKRSATATSLRVAYRRLGKTTRSSWLGSLETA
jgi:Adenylate and Guanylate cyclase catalytic domain